MTEQVDRDGEGGFDILVNRSRGDTVFIPAEGPELDALVEKVAQGIADIFEGCDFVPGDWLPEARAAIEAMRGKP